MPMPIDIEAAELEGMLWKPTGEIRWYRPKGGDDNDKRLELLWERVSGERQWRPIPYFMED
jgi:hypothetical protein